MFFVRRINYFFILCQNTMSDFPQIVQIVCSLYKMWTIWEKSEVYLCIINQRMNHSHKKQPVVCIRMTREMKEMLNHYEIKRNKLPSSGFVKYLKFLQLSNIFEIRYLKRIFMTSLIICQVLEQVSNVRIILFQQGIKWRI